MITRHLLTAHLITWRLVVCCVTAAGHHGVVHAGAVSGARITDDGGLAQAWLQCRPVCVSR